MGREWAFALGLGGGCSLRSFAGPVLSVSRRAQDDTVFLASRFGVILIDQRERRISWYGRGVGLCFGAGGGRSLRSFAGLRTTRCFWHLALVSS